MVRSIFLLFSGLLLFLPISISGVELFANALLLVFLVHVIKNRKNAMGFIKSCSLGQVDIPTMGYLGIGVLGALRVVVNLGDDSVRWQDAIEVLSGMRWILFLIVFTYSLRYLKFHIENVNRTWVDRILLAFATINLALAGLAGWQMFSGGDIQALLFGRRPEVIHQFGDFYRAAGFFGMPLTFAYSQGLFGFIFLGATFVRFSHDSPKSTLTRLDWVLAVSGLACSFSVFASGTRGAWMAWLIASIFLLAGFLSLGTGSLRLRRIVLSCCLFFGMASGLAVSSAPSLRERVLSSFDFSQHELRANMWRVNWHIFLDHPLVGVGFDQNTKRPIMDQYYDRLQIEKRQFSHAHNNFLHILAGMGILGFLCFCLVSIWFLWVAWMEMKNLNNSNPIRGLSLGALAAQIFLHFGGLTECNFKDQEVNFAIVLIWSFLGAIYLNRRKIRGFLESRAC